MSYVPYDLVKQDVVCTIWSSETRCRMYHMYIYIYIISECQSSYTCECLAHFTQNNLCNEYYLYKLSIHFSYLNHNVLLLFTFVISDYFKAFTQLRYYSILSLTTFLLLIFIDKTHANYFIKLLNTSFFHEKAIQCCSTLVH